MAMTCCILRLKLHHGEEDFNHKYGLLCVVRLCSRISLFISIIFVSLCYTLFILGGYDPFYSSISLTMERKIQ